jgi:hypothetical protein
MFWLGGFLLKCTTSNAASSDIQIKPTEPDGKSKRITNVDVL